MEVVEAKAKQGSSWPINLTPNPESEKIKKDRNESATIITYVSHFKFETADGTQFDHRAWVDIIVDEDNDINDWQILNASNSLDLSSAVNYNKPDKVDKNCNLKLVAPALFFFVHFTSSFHNKSYQQVLIH